MTARDLLEDMEYSLLQGSVDTEVTDLAYDSREAREGGMFVCLRGAARDGHDFAPEVARGGVAALVVEREVDVPEDVTVIRVKDARLALARLSAAYFGHPARELRTIGITGTKGKTTTAYMVRAILEESGIRTGLIGTIETIVGDRHTPAGNTTPESFLVQKTFREMADAGCQAVVMEVSSQGLKLHRVGGFTFDYGVFTNLEPDHIGPNEHKDLDEYVRCKAMLFRQCRVGILNLDSEYFGRVTEGHSCKIETFGLGEGASLRAANARMLRKPGVLGVEYDVEGALSFPVAVDIPGTFSVYNSLCAIAVCRHFGAPEAAMRKALLSVKVRGRVELIPVSDEYTLMIDYAHNAMSLESLLRTLREYGPKRLVCLFGCGGNRSRIRRFEMGEVSSRLADLTVITSDNPRDEDPQAIVDDIAVGARRGGGEFVTILDRKEAIRSCIENAREGDVIVLAGKGHEDYQEIKGKKYKMDERDLIRDILEERQASRGSLGA